MITCAYGRGEASVAIIRSWGGDGLSAGSATTASAGTGDTPFTTVGSGITIAAEGGRSPLLKWPATSSSANVRWNALGNLTTWAVRVYVRFDTLPSAAFGLIGAFNGGGTELWRLECSGSNVPRVRNGSTATNTWSANGAFAAGTNYRLELQGDTSGAAQVQIFSGESTTPLYSGTATVPTTAIDEFRFGQTASSATAERMMDDFAVSDTAIAINAVAPDDSGATTGVIRSWSGSGLAAGPMTTASIGTGDQAFTTVTEGLTIVNSGSRSPRIAWPTSSGAHQVRWNGLGNLTKWAVRRYFEVTTIPTTTWHLMTGLDSSGAELWRVEFNGSGLLRLRNATTSTYSATYAALQAGMTYRCEVIGDSVSGAATVYLYVGDYTTARITGVGGIGANPLDEVRFGHYTPQATQGEFGDDFAISNTNVLIGPTVDGGAEPSPPLTRHWGGDGLMAGDGLSSGSIGTGDTAFNSVVGGPTIVQGGKRSPRIALPDSAQSKRFGWFPLGGSTLTSYAIRWYAVMDALPGSELYLASGVLSGGGAWSVRLLADGRLRLRDDAAAVVRWTATASNAIPAGVTVRYELVVDNGAASVSAYRADYVTPIITGYGALTSGIDEVRFGSTTAVSTTGLYYDDLAFSSAATTIGPAGAPAPPITTFFLEEGVWKPMLTDIM